jgi:hypothetical protein
MGESKISLGNLCSFGLEEYRLVITATWDIWSFPLPDRTVIHYDDEMILNFFIVFLTIKTISVWSK